MSEASSPILVAKVPQLSAEGAAAPLAPNLLWLDRLCNGLLSQARFAGFFAGRSSTESALIVVRPLHAKIAWALVWPHERDFPVNALTALGLEVLAETPLHTSGKFSDKELKSLLMHSTRVTPWPDPESA